MIRYAVWCDNSSGCLAAFRVVEAATSAAAIAREQGLGFSTDVVAIDGTLHIIGFGNIPKMTRESCWRDRQASGFPPMHSR